MDFMGDRVTRGLFAPTISYHAGLFYVVCTDIDGEGNFVVTAKDPAGPWSDPVWLKEVHGIDPSLFFDGDKSYIIYNSNPPSSGALYEGHRTIRMSEFDAVNLKVNGPEILLVNGGVDISKKPVWIEGPHIYKRDGYYYLMAAEGGTSVNHTEVIFRSRDVKGPYLPYDKNPILTQKHLNPARPNPITSTGHADLVEGPDGNTWAVFLAVRPYEGNHYNTGRETFIAPVKWTDGWPVINPDHQEVQYEYPATWKEIKTAAPIPLNGNFTHKDDFADSLSNHYLFLRTFDPSWFKLAKGKGLSLRLLPETIMGAGNPAFVGRRQQHLNCNVLTEMDFKARKGNEKAGLAVFQSENHFYYICKSTAGGKDIIQLFKGSSEGKDMELVAEAPLLKPSQKVYLKVTARSDKYAFMYAVNEGDWHVLKDNVDGKFLSTQTAGGFVGVLFGMYATSGGVSSDNSASFKRLEYSGEDVLTK